MKKTLLIGISTLMVLHLSQAEILEGTYGEGRAFYRILSSEPTRIVWLESMPNPDDPMNILTFLVWEHGHTSQPSHVDYDISIAFDLTGTWSTQNIWHVDLGNTQYPTNFTPSNAFEDSNTFEQLRAYTLEHVTDEETQWASMVSDIPLYFAREEIVVTFSEGVTDDDCVALIEGYGNTILERSVSRPSYRVAVPINEEIAWTSIYETNSIVRYAEVNGIIHGAF